MKKNGYRKFLQKHFKNIIAIQADNLIFLKALMLNPRSMGAPMPSSKNLAKEMVAHVPLRSKKMVIELGPGTGVITKALLAKGIAADRLVVIERAKSFAKKLQKRFPKVKIIRGNAANLKKLLGKNKNVGIIVSSLPLLSLPKKTTNKILKQIVEVLPKGGRYIQFTYSYKENTFKQLKHFKKISSKRVWKNLPPARVDVFKV